MPTVGKKKFPYTAKGKAAAKKAATKSTKPRKVAAITAARRKAKKVY